jgi:drug/metabolite transporter (DMT)-like permease
MLVARATHELIPPVALAFWRWFATLLLLLPFTAATLLRYRQEVAREWRDLIVLGALGMGVCGAFVYIGADTTTATNIGLIYAASPILIVVFARLWYGEALSARQGLGVALSLLGVLAVVCRGDPAVLFGLRFSAGDLWILAAMVAWALYSVLLRHRPSRLPLMARFAGITGGGVLVLLPFALGEVLAGRLPALDGTTLASVAFLAVVASFGAYQVYGLIQRSLGAGPTSLLMYLIPLYNGGLAFLLLGERLEPYHLAGAALVLPGIFLATRRELTRA